MKSDLRRPVSTKAMVALRIVFAVTLIWGTETLSWTIAVREPVPILTVGTACMVLVALNAALWTKSIRWVW